MFISKFHGYTDDELRDMRSRMVDCEDTSWHQRFFFDITEELNNRRQLRRSAQRHAKAPICRAKHLLHEVAGEISSPRVEWHAH